ncbi:TraB/GumN family protein [Stenotrophomonas sp. LC732]|uniref:TraB/GumN family protein n=2 Tax=Lysobacteraceae TaxID=32033 RepID=UPI00130DE91B|nr:MULTISPECIES: TraB/GumN family protein [Stenotrophomonas]MBF9139159.1 TraB/GumN family protein [Stenotrophomonas sp. 232]MBH1517150.1 TraB/GumN family protein [Stenotrophomonas maltophilia]MBH1574733.1 TraB/GumN family protein [Stenotrophomonas maltophilia]MBH1777184.1 TraB/GumN family protein [Stenotrophomonas maltophilia]MBN4975627.1 TraB/GumN family protein [Stenotrophomonas maltophilia]
MPGLNMGGLRTSSIGLIGLILIALSSADGYARDQEEPSITPLRTVHATPPRPGPRIWKFTKGYSTVLVLGTVQPLRKGLFIDTRSVEAAISASDVVLSSPGVTIEHDGGFFGGLLLWPSIRKLKFLDGDRTLRDALTGAEYARWNELKHRYHLRDASIERMRPMYAAWKAHDTALRTSEIRTDSHLSKAILQAARRHRKPIVDARFSVPVKAAKQTIQRFHIDPALDRRCFVDATSSLQPWLDRVDEIGRAWADGDIEADVLLHAPSSPSRCWVRLTNDAIANTMNLNLDVESRTHWLEALRSTTSRHNIVFTTLPLEDLLHSKGMAAALMEEGYTSDAGAIAGDQPFPSYPTSVN